MGIKIVPQPSIPASGFEVDCTAYSAKRGLLKRGEGAKMKESTTLDKTVRGREDSTMRRQMSASHTSPIPGHGSMRRPLVGR
jgi:hypothetical protein